jgi:Tol biopolymer transport system component
VSSIPRPLLGLFVVLALALTAAPAEASFPGQNGQLAFERGGQIVLSNPDGSNERVLTTGGDPAWSPNGRQIAYHFGSSLRCNNGLETVWELRVINADGTGQRTVTRGNRTNCAAGAAQPAWSPDGTRLAFVDGIGGEGRSDGIVTEGAGRSVFTVPVNGGNFTRITTGLRSYGRPSWSPDGTKIAFEGETPFAGPIPANGDIYTVNPNGTSLTRVTTNARDDFAPAWSPDSSHMVFTSERDDTHLAGCDGDTSPPCNTEIYTMNRDGTNVQRITNRGPSIKDSYAVYSPDGTQFLFTSDRFSATNPPTFFGTIPTMRLHRLTADGTLEMTLFDGINPDWQPATAAVPLTAGLGYLSIRDDQRLFRADQPTGTMQVHLTERAPLGGTTITLSSDDPAHAAPPPTVTVPAGATTASFDVALTAPTGTSVFPTITASFGARSVKQQFEIFANAQMSQMGIGNVRQEGNQAIFHLTAPAPAGGAVVSLTSSDPVVAPVPATVTVPEGESQGQFPMFIKTVTAAETITITASYGGNSVSDSATVQPDPKVVSVTLDPTSVVGGAVNTGFSVATVTVDHPAPAPLVVSMATDNAHARLSDIHISQGGTTGQVNVNTDPVASDETANISATAGGQTRSAALTIRSGTPIQPAQPDVATFTLTPNTVANGGTVQGKVTLASPAPTGGTTVRFTQDLNAPNVVRSVPDAVIPAGGVSSTFPVTAQFTSPNPTTGTIVARTVTQTGLGAAVSAQLTVTPAADPPPPPPAGDTVRITRAQYDSGKRSLRVEATSTSSTATLTAFNNTTNAQIGVLQNNGGGTYRGTFNNVANPGNVRVTSSLGGTAVLVVSGATGTVRPAAVVVTTGASLVTPAAKALVLHATSEVALPKADPADRTAPRIGPLRLLPNRIRVGSRHGTLVSFTLDEPARVTLSFARRSGARFVAVRGGLERTLPAGRVRVRFHGVLADGPLRTGVYRVIVNAADGSGNRAASRRAVLTLR